MPVYNPLPGHIQTYYNQLAYLSNKLKRLWSQGGIPKDSLTCVCVCVLNLA